MTYSSRPRTELGAGSLVVGRACWVPLGATGCHWVPPSACRLHTLPETAKGRVEARIIVKQIVKQYYGSQAILVETRTVQRTDDAGLRPPTAPPFHLLSDDYWLATCCILHPAPPLLRPALVSLLIIRVRGHYLHWIPLIRGVLSAAEMLLDTPIPESRATCVLDRRPWLRLCWHASSASLVPSIEH